MRGYSLVGALVLSFASFSGVNSQGFNKLFNFKVADGFFSVVNSEVNYYTFGRSVDLAHDSGFSTYSKFDILGSLLWAKVDGGKGHSPLNHRLKTTWNGERIGIYADRKDDTAFYRSYIRVWDGNDSLIKSFDTTISSSYSCYPYEFTLCRDSGLVVLGFITDSCTGCPSYPWILRYDKDFNELFRVRYTDYVWSDFYDVKVDDSCNIYLAGAMQASAGSYTQALVVKLDSRGNTLWRKIYGSSYDDYASRLSILSPNRIAVGGIAYSSNFWEDARSRITIIDSTGTTQHDKIFRGDSALSHEYIKIISSSPDSMLVCTFPSYNSGVQDTFFLMSIDTNLNVHWYVPVAPSITHHTEIYDFQLTPDKGYIFCGSSNYGTQDAWLVKMDSNLCANEWCWHTTGMPSIEAELSQLKVYPNPADDYLTLAFDFKESEDVHYTILDLQGRVLLKEGVKFQGNSLEQDISLHGLSAGMYILKVDFKNQSFSRKFVKR